MKTTRKTTTRKSVAVKAAEVDTQVETAGETKLDIKARFQDAFESAKARSSDNRLAMLGLIANARTAGEERKANMEERKADLIEAGRAYEPELQAKMDELKAKFKFDGEKLGKFSFALPKKDEKGEPSKFGTALNERMAQSFERLGLPTRRDFDALSKQVDKLIELQRA